MGVEAPTQDLAPHVERTLRAVAQMHADHRRQATRAENIVDRATALLGAPSFLVVLGLFVLLWVSLNLSLLAAGQMPFDAPPFPWLGGFLSLAALYMGVLILITQRRADQLANRREQMTLELSMTGEQKTAKIIELIEELRLDSPQVRNRVDKEATAMAKPADPHAALEGVKEPIEEAHAKQFPASPIANELRDAE